MKKSIIKVLVILFFISAIAGIYYSNKKQSQTKKSQQAKPNILIVSLCSVNSSMLPLFGNGQKEEFPNLYDFFNSSILVKNAITDVAWSNINRYLKFSDPSFFRLNGYSGISNQIQLTEFDEHTEDFKTFWRWPPLEHKSIDEDLMVSFKNHTDKDLQKGVSEIIDLLKKPRSRSFFLLTHLKFMHFPYLNFDLNDDDASLKVLTEKEISLLRKYKNNYLKYPEKFAFFDVVFPDLKYLQIKENLLKEKIILANDPEMVARWKKSKDFDLDLSILRKIYKNRLQVLDFELGKLINYYNEFLKNNTILVISADHGESLLEHNYLTHAYIPYDETIKFFYSVKFPHQNQKIVFNEQISQENLAETLIGLTKNSFVNEKQFEKILYNKKSDNVLSYSCGGEYFSIRHKNQWKYILNIATDEEFLFNLNSDPGELVNLAQEHIELTIEFKQLIKIELSQNNKQFVVCGNSFN